MFTDRRATARAFEPARPAPTRFAFDRDHARPASEGDREAEERAQAIAAARAEGFEAGHLAGRQSAGAAAAAQLAASAEKAAGAAAALLAEVDAALARLRAEAAAATLAAARSLAAHLIDREPLGEIEALLEDCLGPLHKAPHLVLRVRADDVEAMRGRFDALAAVHGFTGRLVILGEPDLGPGDCRIEWADGGIVRDFGKALGQLEAALQARFPHAMIAEADQP